MQGALFFYNGWTEIVHVTVQPKTLSNPYHPSVMPTASPLSYYFNGMEASSYTLQRGTTYLFDQSSDASNFGHPMRFYLTNDRNLLYAPPPNELPSPGAALDVVGKATFVVGTLTPKTYAPNTPNSLSYQS